MKKFIITLIASSVIFSSASFACSAHKHLHKNKATSTAEHSKK